MTKPTRRRLSPEERRRELLVFGQRFFAENPADAFTMDQIAERAGVSKGLLYNYFGGRRGFYVATVEAIAQDVRDLTRPESNMPFTDAFQRALERYLDWVAANGDVYRVLVQGGLGVDPEVGSVVEELRRHTVAQIAGRAALERTPAVEFALYGWVCFAENACLDWLNKSIDRPTVVAIFTGALLGALAACGAQINA